MQNSLIAFNLMILAALAGCGQTVPVAPGGPVMPAEKPAAGQANATFRLSVPGASHLKQGQSKPVAIGITRDAGFGQDVALTFSGMPRGVTLQPNAPVLKAGYSEVQVTVSAARDSVLGDFRINIVSNPTTAAASAHELQLSVTKD